MKSDNKAPTITQDLQQELQAEFLLCELRDARTEFKMELARVGLKFIRDNLDPRQRDLFTETFDELVWLGCRPSVLASTLYCYYKSRLWIPDAPESKEVKEYAPGCRNL